jgi:NhaA family Na+:H+ antiporter
MLRHAPCPPGVSMTPAKPQPELARLPHELVDRFARPFSHFLRIEAAAGGLLLLVAALAVVLSNTPAAATLESVWHTPISVVIGELDYGRSLRDWINDAAMTLFFFLVALELKRELVLGELRNPRMATLSIAAAAGGMIVPAAIYLALQGGETGHSGWGTVMATDTAFVVACLTLLRRRIPKSLRVFMLSLAIVDDVGAIVVVAVGYSHGFHGIALALAGVLLGAVALMQRIGLRNFAPYIIAGIVLWLAVDASGIHATVTGVVLGLMTPARRWVSDQRLYAILERVIAHPADAASSAATRDRKTLQAAEIAARESLSPVERLEIALHPWVGFVIMPLFAFANAGLPLSSVTAGSTVTWAIVAGLALGKPLGVLSFTWIAVQSGMATRPASLRWRFIAGGALLAGIGFTMSLFIAQRAFDPALLDDAKLGIYLASLISAALGLAVLWAWPVRRTRAVANAA